MSVQTFFGTTFHFLNFPWWIVLFGSDDHCERKHGALRRWNPRLHAGRRSKRGASSKDLQATAHSLIKKHLPLASRCSILGVVVGALPGAGGDIAALMVYDYAKRSVKTPERPFGESFCLFVFAMT
jgi:hypothetical protein